MLYINSLISDRLKHEFKLRESDLLYLYLYLDLKGLGVKNVTAFKIYKASVCRRNMEVIYLSFNKLLRRNYFKRISERKHCEAELFFKFELRYKELFKEINDLHLKRVDEVLKMKK